MRNVSIYSSCVFESLFFLRTIKWKIRNKNIFLSFIEFSCNICFQVFYPDIDFWQYADVRYTCTSLHEPVDKRKECQQQ